jgi:hypothetical protein
MHVGDLDGSAQAKRRWWRAVVTITVHDADHNLVANATVSGIWSIDGTSTCTTGKKGTCKVIKSGISYGTASVTFAVENVIHASLTYVPDDNEETSITIDSP